MARPSVEADRREQILAAACDVLSELGFRSLRVSDVAKRARTSTGTVHYYFATKRDLVHAAFEFNFDRSLARRRPLLEKHEHPRDRLHAFVASYLPADAETVKAWAVWVELWCEALHEEDLRELNERVYGEWRGVIAGVIREGQKQGCFRPGDPLVLANQLIGMIDGLAMQVLLRSRSMTVSRMRKVCDAALAALET